MISPPRLSIVIPHRNDQAGLRLCLTSLTAQRDPELPFEIIVVDNGSTTPPVELCAGFPDVRLVMEPTPGPGPARNHGASLAAAELIAFVDADCTPAPDWAGTIVDFMDSHPAVDFIGGDIRLSRAGKDRMSAIESFESVYGYQARRYVERLGFAATGNMAVRRRVFTEVGPFGGIATMEDTEWGQRASDLGYRIAFVEHARVFTPPCRSFDELVRRWDRHIAHEYRQYAERRFGLARWLFLALLLAGSPAAEIARILRTDRLSGIRSRTLAFTCLTCVRLYRAWRMVTIALNDTSSTVVASWNREGS